MIPKSCLANWKKQTTFLKWSHVSKVHLHLCFGRYNHRKRAYKETCANAYFIHSNVPILYGLAVIVWDVDRFYGEEQLHHCSFVQLLNDGILNKKDPCGKKYLPTAFMAFISMDPQAKNQCSMLIIIQSVCIHGFHLMMIMTNWILIPH